eukprot:4069221-Pleurochrysis_carterae.AAC.3
MRGGSPAVCGVLLDATPAVQSISARLSAKSAITTVGPCWELFVHRWSRRALCAGVTDTRALATRLRSGLSAWPTRYVPATGAQKR